MHMVMYGFRLAEKPRTVESIGMYKLLAAVEEEADIEMFILRVTFDEEYTSY